MADKKDYLGDFVLWSLGIGFAGIVLSSVTGIRLFGIVAAIALGGFGITVRCRRVDTAV